MADVNDPRESKDWLPVLTFGSVALPGTMTYQDFLVEFNKVMREQTKVLCFTRDDPSMTPDSPPDLYGWGYAHSRMWDRYGDGHRGVCLIFDIDSLGDEVAQSVGTRGELLHTGVSYFNYPPGESDAFTMSTDDIAARGVAGALVAHRSAHHGVLYFYKAVDWQSENELRWILFSDHADRWEYISIERSLAGVIFGVDCSGDEIRRIRWLLRKRHDMKFATMQFRNGHPIPILLP